MESVIIFVRVSPFMQEYERLIRELQSLAVQNVWTVEAVFAEKITKNRKYNCANNKILNYDNK